MPNFDHKGPEGLGPKTGMKQGTCRTTILDNNAIPEKRPFGNGRRKNHNNFKITKLNLEK